MLRADYQKWNQSLDELRQLSVEADHARSRERYQALYMVGSGAYNATAWVNGVATSLVWARRWF